jgi:hypothetical protein
LDGFKVGGKSTKRHESQEIKVPERSKLMHLARTLVNPGKKMPSRLGVRNKQPKMRIKNATVEIK